MPAVREAEEEDEEEEEENDNEGEEVEYRVPDSDSDESSIPTGSSLPRNAIASAVPAIVTSDERISDARRDTSVPAVPHTRDPLGTSRTLDPTSGSSSNFQNFHVREIDRRTSIRHVHPLPIDVTAISQNSHPPEFPTNQIPAYTPSHQRPRDPETNFHRETHSDQRPLRPENNKKQHDAVNRENSNCENIIVARDSRMAATAKHEQLRGKFPSDSSGDEDIAAIAKQISDHAEAIYQTWKSRGLAPTEILNCHSNATAADKFGTVLTPSANVPMSGKKSSNSPATSPTAVEILARSPGLDNNNLEKLVNNFVVEDRARLAAAGRQRSPAKTLPSSIQFALQKFERNSTPHTSPVKTPTGGVVQTIAKSSIQQKTIVVTSPTSNFTNKPSLTGKPQLSPKITVGSHHNDVFFETIETTFPADLTPSKISVQQKRPSSTVIPSQLGTNSSIVETTSTTSGLTTWPLKNKMGDPRRTSNSTSPIAADPRAESPSKEDVFTNVAGSRSNSGGIYSVNAYLDEVAREEERLINALKTGAVITEDSTILDRSNVTATVTSVGRQKPAIKKEKPKVDAVKPIILGLGATPIGVNSIVGNVTTPTSAILVNNVLTGSSMNSSLTNDPKISNKDDFTTMSMVDYAKVRYRAAQQDPTSRRRFEDDKNPGTSYETSSEQLVSTARTKFEPEIVGKSGKDASKDERDFVTSRWGPRVNSPRPRLDQVPHPELTTQQKQHIRAAAATGTGTNPVRPFLTRGSVAERVLIFEKCPSELLLDKRGPRQPAVVNWRTGHEVQNKLENYPRDKTQQKGLPPHTTLQRHVKANRNVHIPRFYFPGGKPTPLSQVEATVAKITAAFQSLPGHRASRSQFHAITKACDLPLYWKVPLFLAADGDKNGFVVMSAFLDFWKELTNAHHDAASKFVRITTKGQRNTIIPEDLIPLIQDVVETHPGLTFLKEATEFHSRYVHTVIARIFYCVNRSWSGKISVSELRRSNLLAVISVLEHEEDINQVTAYFSYEHFYVIYCKFWELDRDHDLFIDKMDLTRHNDHALSTRLIERIFSGAVTRGGVKSGVSQQPEDKMSYTEFVWFLLSEEDKNHPTAIEYWFRCMDLDGDGYLSMYELEYFYEEQLHRMEAIGMETLPFEDCLCQMLDMIHPSTAGKISLSDLKKCKMTSIFFDTFFNLEKYLDHEQRDPFASTRDHDADGHELSDWDRFAADEYELLVAEESGNDQNEQMSYENGADDDVYPPNPDVTIGIETSTESNDVRDIVPAGFEDDVPSRDPTSSKINNYDSGESDDYAESDN